MLSLSHEHLQYTREALFASDLYQCTYAVDCLQMFCKSSYSDVDKYIYMHLPFDVYIKVSLDI